jgi:hypothetical protein
MTIDLRDEQPANASSPTTESWDPASSLNSDSALHPEKHFSQRALTDKGTIRDRSDAQPTKAIAPILFKHESGANVTSERQSQFRKHSRPRDLIDAGTAYDVIS